MQTPGTMISATTIVELHDRLTRAWHASEKDQDPKQAPIFFAAARDVQAASSTLATDFLTHVADQHRANFDLWHIEDEARAPGATDAALAVVKRRIDATNQLRNDLAEQLDHILIEWLGSQGLPNSNAALHSESPGLMIDRLSIQALKIYHTADETERRGAPDGHSERNRDRLVVLREQRADLMACLDALWRETLAGTRRFKVYRQLKMYNDPSLNPAIYSRSDSERGS